MSLPLYQGLDPGLHASVISWLLTCGEMISSCHRVAADCAELVGPINRDTVWAVEALASPILHLLSHSGNRWGEGVLSGRRHMTAVT